MPGTSGRGHGPLEAVEDDIETVLELIAEVVAGLQLLEAGQVTPVIDRTYPLSEAAQAMDHVGAGHARGKVAISV